MLSSISTLVYVLLEYKCRMIGLLNRSSPELLMGFLLCPMLSIIQHKYLQRYANSVNIVSVKIKSTKILC